MSLRLVQHQKDFQNRVLSVVIAGVDRGATGVEGPAVARRTAMAEQRGHNACAAPAPTHSLVILNAVKDPRLFFASRRGNKPTSNRIEKLPEVPGTRRLAN